MKMMKLDLSILKFLFDENYTMEDIVDGEFNVTFVDKAIYSGNVIGLREFFSELFKQADNGFMKAEVRFKDSTFIVNMLSSVKQEITLLALDIILGSRVINGQTHNNDFVILLTELNKCVTIEGPHNCLIQNVLDAVLFNNFDDDDLDFNLAYLHNLQLTEFDVSIDISRMHQILQDKDLKDKFGVDINYVLAKNSILNYYMVYDGDELNASVIKRARVTFISNDLSIIVYQVFDLYKELDFLADEIAKKKIRVTFVETIQDEKGLI